MSPMFLITGGAGFIGSHTAALLTSLGHRVRVLDDLSSGKLENLAGLDLEFQRGDLSQPADVARAVRGCTHVIHLAARPGVPASCEDPAGSDLVNVHGTVLLFEAARRAGVQRVAYASSCAVYGDVEGSSVDEATALRPLSPYAASKVADEYYGAVFQRTLGLECVGLRYFNVFGTRQDPFGPYAAVIPRFVELALRGGPLPIHGDGEQSRDFVAVTDVARANLLAATTPGLAGAYNIGTGRRTTVNQVARLVLETITGSEPHPSQRVQEPPREGDIRHMIAGTARAREALGWRPQAAFEPSIRRTIRWYRSTLQAHEPTPTGGRGSSPALRST